MTTVKDILDRARQEIGQRETAGNRTRYGEWYGMNGQPWCAIFVSWVFYHEGLPLPFTTRKGFAYTPSGVAKFRQLKQWHSSNPKSGDVVFFNFGGGRVNHVGIVESVNGDGSITTIEGNTSDMVKRMKRRSSIAGYGRPQYAEQPSPAPSPSLDIMSIIREVLNEGTAYGQRNWAGTCEETLRCKQGTVNLLRGEVMTNQMTHTGDVMAQLQARSQALDALQHQITTLRSVIADLST